ASAAELQRSGRPGPRGLRRVDHGDAERLFQRATMARHSGATHDHRLRAVPLLQLAPDVDHAPERLFAACRLSNRHFERTFAGEAVGDPHLKQIAPMPGDRALAYGNDADAARARERAEHAAVGSAIYLPRG